MIAKAEECGGKLPIRVNWILEEAGNIPTIPDFESMMTNSRSRNIDSSGISVCSRLRRSIRSILLLEIATARISELERHGTYVYFPPLGTYRRS
ncbi:MAG: type IV secretory system conjugative DNA transfer family protein [[Clostridium] scindens]